MSASSKLSASLGFTLLVALLGLLGIETPAHADHVGETRTNRDYLYSGLTTLFLSYVPAVVVASESSRAGDKSLYVPVAGPWMDLAIRKDCPAEVSCSNETANKVLLVVDGIFQGLGAIDILAAFLLPERVESRPRDEAHERPTFRVVPGHVSTTAYGLFAIGSF